MASSIGEKLQGFLHPRPLPSSNTYNQNQVPQVYDNQYPPPPPQYSQNLPVPTSQGWYQNQVTYDQPPNVDGKASYGQWQQPPGQFVPQQAAGYTQQYSQQLPPQHGQVPNNLTFNKCGRKMFTMVDRNTNQTLYTFNFSFGCSAGTLYVNRGDGSSVGSAKFHSFSGKPDMTLGNTMVRVKRSFPSQTGLGFLVWRKDGASCFSRKGNLVLEGGGTRIATFILEKGPTYYNRQGGGIDIHKLGLTQQQLEEIVVSAVVELERLRIVNSSTG